MQIFDSIKTIIEGVNPDIVVIDYFLNPAVDACYSLNREFVINTPNTPLDVVKVDQPWLKGFWYYPMFVLFSFSCCGSETTTVLNRLASGISFPVSWRNMIPNVVAAAVLTWKTATSSEIARLEKHRGSRGLLKGLPLWWEYSKAVHIICPGVREVDLPLFKIRDNLGLYGPVVLDTTPVEVSGPELNQWLSRGETVLMCMGTHFHYSKSQVKAILKGFLGAVTPGSNTQLLWKLGGKSKFEDVIEEALKDPGNRERVRIVDWLEADPISVLKHPNVVVWAHHGGANSYFEGALSVN